MSAYEITCNGSRQHEFYPTRAMAEASLLGRSDRPDMKHLPIDMQEYLVVQKTAKIVWDVEEVPDSYVEAHAHHAKFLHDDLAHLQRHPRGHVIPDPEAASNGPKGCDVCEDAPVEDAVP